MKIKCSLLNLAFLILMICITIFSQAQKDSSNSIPSVFEKITTELKDYKIDTTPPPDDKITKLIQKLSDLKGGFNINEAIDFKIQEDRNKKEMPEAELKKVEEYFKGPGKTKLDNAVSWIYRHHFTYKELKYLVKFYKTSAGQKMSEKFPVIMLQSLMAAQMLQSNLTGKK